ncbi:MAG: hypothetical protein QXO21_06090 [Candidatus Anstonellales archaeon]
MDCSKFSVIKILETISPIPKEPTIPEERNNSPTIANIPIIIINATKSMFIKLYLKCSLNIF